MKKNKKILHSIHDIHDIHSNDPGITGLNGFSNRKRGRRFLIRRVPVMLLTAALLLQGGCSEQGGSGESGVPTETEDLSTELRETPGPTPSAEPGSNSEPETKESETTPEPGTKEPATSPEPDTKEPVTSPEPDTKEPVTSPEPDTKEPATSPEPDTKEPVTDPEPGTQEETGTPGGSELPAISPDYELYGAKAYSYLKEFVSAYPYRLCGSDQEKAAGEWIKGKLESFGYEVSRQDFRLIDQDGDNYPDEAIGLYQDSEYPIFGTSQNYFCTKPGKTGKILVVSAHYDCMDTTGADDNGSGVAALLELVEHYKNMEPLEYTLLFAFYGSEEPGMKGSVYHVRELMGNGGFADIAGVINIDSIAAGDNLYIHGGVPQADGSISQYGLAALALKLSDAEGLGMTTHPDTDKIPEKTRVYGSDQFHFAANGKPYVYFEANLYSNTQPDNIPQWYQTADKRVPGGQIMHTEYDNLDTIETLWPGRTRDHLRRFEVILNLLLPNITDSVLNA